jgi:peroxiredoxin
MSKKRITHEGIDVAAFSFLTLLALLPVSGEVPPPVGQHVENFELPDCRGQVHRLTDWRESRTVVLAFMGTECPLVKLYVPRLIELEKVHGPKNVRIVGINANQQDTSAKIADFVREHGIPFPILRDEGNTLADRLGAQRTPEVFLLDQARVIRYHGRIDDQYAVGQQKPKPGRRDLALAIEDLLAGRAVQVANTEAVGCFIGRVKRSEERGTVTFTRDVAPVLYKHCVACHRPGSIAPFSLLTYRQASGWADTIQEVIAAGRMPPWLASPKYGKFANEARLSEAEKALIGEWIRHGVPEGDPRELPRPPVFSEDWRIPKPDFVLQMPVEFELPATGPIDYQYFEIDPGFTEDKWIQAAELRPGNRAVVHHSLVFLKPPGSDYLAPQGELQSVYLTTASAATPPLNLPPGMAKKIPAGWRLVIQMHYTTTGKPERDRSSLGLVFADPQTVRKEVATNLMANFDLNIPPNTPDVIVEASRQFDQNFLLLSMSPHMHLRGKSFRYEARYPDGTREILLDVPRYDFGWQGNYYLAEPKLLPRGTVLHCTAHFDNSAANPVNPDPSATVKWGKQSWDEMMVGYIEIALADQDLTRPTPWHETAWRITRRVFQPQYAVFMLAGLWLVWRRTRVSK